VKTAHPQRPAPDAKFADPATPLLDVKGIEVRY